VLIVQEPGEHDQQWKAHECDQRLPDIDAIRSDEQENHHQPHVREDRECRCADVHVEAFDLISGSASALVTAAADLPPTFLPPASVGGTATTQTPVIINRLYAADPTIVDGPSSPEKKSLPTISMMLSKISGAEEPSAISVRFATVAFQILHTTRQQQVCVAPCGPPPLTFTGTVAPVFVIVTVSCDVTTSMAAMKVSAMIPTPKKAHSNPSKYRIARSV
jgi:hypothetical protein